MDVTQEKNQAKVKDKVPVWRNVKELFRISWEVDKRYIYRSLFDEGNR